MQLATTSNFLDVLQGRGNRNKYSRNKSHSLYGYWCKKEVSLLYLHRLCLNYGEQKTTDLPKISVLCFKLNVKELEIRND